MKNLVLLGAGHAHVHVLSSLAAHPLAGVQVTLVAPYPRQLYSGMMPGFVAGHYALQDCVIPLAPLLKIPNVRWLRHRVSGLDARTRTLTLDDGAVLGYDWLSVNTGGVHGRLPTDQPLAGASEHALFLRPIEDFGTRWPDVLAMAAIRPLRIAIIGGGAAGIEMSMAIRQRLPNCSVTLITGSNELAESFAPLVRQRVGLALRQREITVLMDRANGIQEGQVSLESGATLACDVPILATPTQAPTWLRDSGLAMDAQGFILVDASQRSTNHLDVFAVGDVCTRVDQALVRNGVHAVRAGPALLANLRAALNDQPLLAHRPPKRTLSLLSCGNRQAIASWGNFSAQGRWVWWLKNWIDRRFVKLYRRD